MKCRLTGKEGAPADAHIIPRSFYRIDSEQQKPWMIIQSEVQQYPKRSPIGIYDNSILTVEGERLFSQYDDHACEVLINHIATRKPTDNAESPHGFYIDGVDYRKLKLFFISLLWRASVTKHSFFKRVGLGPKFEEKARNHILADDPGDRDNFGVVVATFHDKIDEGFGILDPVRLRFDHTNYVLFYLNHIIAYIKVDSRPIESPFDDIALAPDKPLLIINRGEFRKSNEFPTMRAIALRNDAHLPAWWKPH